MILIFSRAPRPGAVKRRLIPALGAQGAAELHERMTEVALETAVSAGVAPVQLWCAPSAEHACFQRLRERYAVTLHCQVGADLGARMHHAFTTVLREHAYAILMGSDCPFLTAEDISTAAEWLMTGWDAVIGPALDGGYVLIGLARPAPDLFADMAWGTDAVLAVTRQRLRSMGWRWSELAARPDVDRPADLDRLPRHWCKGRL